MKRFLKKLAARLPKRWQAELKRLYFGSQIRGRRFRTNEPEYDLLSQLISPGDWILDVGANVGHYTARFSELVGAGGRVIAFEPVPETFELLAANVALLPGRNVTLINAAASDSARVAGMEIPAFDVGLANYYMAHLSAAVSALNVLCVAVDSLNLPHPVRLVKIDAEGHEVEVLRGMQALLRRDRPILIVEDNSTELMPFLEALGYSTGKLKGSSNQVASDYRLLERLGLRTARSETAP